MSDTSTRRPVFGRAAFYVLVVCLGLGGWMITSPTSPLPAAWNPMRPLVVADPVTPLTTWKLRRTVADPAACRAALDPAARFTAMSDFEASEQCHIRNRIALSAVGGTRIGPVETTCAVALRLAMWEAHSLQPAAQLTERQVSAIGQIGSYNCRAMRTTSGGTQRMSTHATAEAIDVRGFGFADGSRVDLLADWAGSGADAAFLRAARDGSCRWFATTLGPDYNSLHADHFHLQSRGWGTCR